MPVFSKSLGNMDWSSPEAVKAIADHIRVMQEELEYSLMVLDSSNISEIDADKAPIIIPNRGNLVKVLDEYEMLMQLLATRIEILEAKEEMEGVIT